MHRVIYSDPEVSPPFAARVLNLDESMERMREKEWFNRHSGGQGWGYWSVVRREDDQLIGMMLLGHPDRIYWKTGYPDLYEASPYIPLFTEIGYALGRAYWGQGYATEAAREVLDYAFRDLRVERFEIPWEKGPLNPRSFNVHRRLDFVPRDGVNVENANVMLIRENHFSNLPPWAADQPSGVSGSPEADIDVKNLDRQQNLKSPKTVETERLLLRGIELDDVAKLTRITNESPSNASSFGRIHSFDVFEGVLRFAQEAPYGTRTRQGWAYDGLGSWAVIRKADDSLIGHVSLGPAARTYWILFEGERDSPYVQWDVDLACVLEESSWDQAFETEACRAMVDYAFSEMRLARIVNHLDEADIPAIRLAESLGFRIGPNFHPGYGGLVAELDNTVAQTGNVALRSG